MVRWMHVRNFRCLRDTRVEFKQSLTVLVGVNNSGKSSILEALHICLGLTALKVPDIFQGERDYFWVHSMDSGDPLVFEICVDTPTKEDGRETFEYRLALNAKEPISSIDVVEERLLRTNQAGIRTVLIERKRGEPDWRFRDERSGKDDQPLKADPKVQGILQLADREAHKGILDFRKVMSGGMFFDFQPSAMKRASAIVPNPILAPDGSNLPAVLDGLQGGFPERYEALVRQLKSLVPEINSLLLPSIQGGQKFLAVKESYSSEAIASLALSDGVLKFIAVLTALSAPSQPKLLLFEEPENNIHPRRLEQLVECFRIFAPGSESNGGQIILTTHSPYLVDKLQPEELLITTRDDSGTRVEPVGKQDAIRHLLEEAPLGELWHRGSIGGVPLP